MTEIAVLSGKGGTGKTSISAAFATLEKNLVVADCDVDAANLYLLLQPENIRSEKFITGYSAVIDEDKCVGCGLCIDYCRFDAIKWQGNKVVISPTLCDGCKLCARICSAQAISMHANNKSAWFIGDYRNGHMVHARLHPGEENSGKLVNVVRNEAKKLASEKKCDILIIDGPPGTGCPAISSIAGVRLVVLVTEPSNSGLHDLQRIVELAESFKVGIAVVINKYDLNIEITRKVEEWCTRNGYPMLGKIPFEREVVESMLYCKSIVEWNPDSEASQSIRSVWTKIKSQI